MFEFIRSHTKWIMFALVVLIIPSFVFFGVQGYRQSDAGANVTVATVAGQKITQAEWDLAHQRQAQRMREQVPNIDPKLLDSPAFKRETLDQLVRERVMFAAVNKMHLNVSDERLQREILAVPQLAALRRPDGSIDLAAYKAMLEAQGMTPEMFEARVRQDAALRQVTAGIDGTVLAPASTTSAALDPLLQRREVQLQRFETKDFLSRVNPSDAELAAYHKAHESEFRTPEQATIEYVTLDLDNLKAGLTVSDEDLRKYYNENASRYTATEERRASHILIKADKDMPAAERAKAKAKAEGLLADLRKKPAAFAELAKKHSDDPGSAEQGGDLDFFSRGAMVKPFEDAAFAMKAGEISNLVESDFGYHIIRLDAVRGGDKKPFEAMRAQIEDEVKRQLAQRRYSEAAEQFSNTVYEQSDSLQPVIDKLKLQKKTATVQRTPSPDATGALASPKLLEAVFANDAVQNKRNTDAIEVAPNQLASARVVTYQPSRVQPLAEVMAAVRERARAEQAAALARKEGEARLAQLKQADTAANLPAAVTVSRAQPQNLSREVLDGVLRADASQLPAVVGIDAGARGYVVARVVQVLPPDVPAPERAQLAQRVSQAWGQAEVLAYFAALKSRFKTEIKVPAVAPVTNQP
jgi:peptidyl-prolyl cis-trans isomerase D